MDQEKTKIPQLKVQEPPPNCPVPPPCPVCPPKPKPWQVCLKILLLLIAGLALAFVILVGSGLRITRKESLLDIWLAGRRGISPTPEVLATPTPDPTANWQVYLNRENGYQIKYPEDIFVRIICPGEELTLEKRKEGEERKIVEMPTCNRDSPYTVEGRTNASNYRVSEPKSDEYYQVTKETVSIGGIEMQKYTKRLVTKPNYPYVEWQQQVWIPHGDKKHYLTFSNKELLEYYDQILSTFKFLDQGVTTGWKEYIFKPLQLSLKAPPELSVHTEESNPGNDFTAYIQNFPFNTPYPKTNAYQLYITWQKTPSITKTEFEQLKDDLVADSIEDTMIAEYPAIKGQVKGERNRFVTYILVNNSEISLFTSDPTESNKKLTDQILSTFKFLK